MRLAGRRGLERLHDSGFDLLIGDRAWRADNNRGLVCPSRGSRSPAAGLLGSWRRESEDSPPQSSSHHRSHQEEDQTQGEITQRTSQESNAEPVKSLNGNADG